MSMELSDGLAIAVLIASEQAITPKALACRNNVPMRNRPRRCTCGECVRCQDNAKWERVFEEKFADPDYYRQTRLRGGSSLSWL
jgi:hypothetical protein